MTKIVIVVVAAAETEIKMHDDTPGGPLHKLYYWSSYYKHA